MNINFYSLLTIFILIVATVLLFLLFFKRKDKEVKYFLALLFTFFVWQSIELSFRLFDLGGNYLFLWKIVLAVVIFSGPLIYDLAFLFGNRTMSRMLKIILYTFSIIFSFLSLFTGLIVEGLSEKMAWGKYYISGPLFMLYVSFLSGIFLLASFQFYKSYKLKENKSAFLVSVGFWITMGGVVLSDFIPSILNIKFPPLGGISTLVLIIILLKSIYSYQLFNFKVKSISLSKKILFAFLFVSILSSFIFAFFAYFHEKENIQLSINNEMESLVQEKGSRLKDYLNDKKNDMDVLSEDIAIRNIFNKKINEDINYAKNEIKNQAKSTVKQVDEFLEKYPKLTLAELQENEEFQKIAVQSVGETGYTALTDSHSLICRFHKNPKIINMDLSKLGKKLPDFWLIMESSRGGKISDGFYDWLEEDGSIRKKYMYIEPVKRSTSDGVYLTVAATTYIDEFNSSFQIMGEAESFLRQYVEKYNFENLFLIGIDDRVWWEARDSFKIGTDIFSLGPEKENFVINYNKVKTGDGAIIFNCGCKKNESFKAFIAIPIHNHFTKDLIGVAIEQLSRKQFSDIINVDKNFGKDKVFYLVDSRRNIIESNSGNNAFTQIEDNINFKKCFTNRNLKTNFINQYYKRVYFYNNNNNNNNNNNKVLGTHFYVEDLDWCLLVETPVSKVMAPLFRLKSFFISIGFLIVLLSVLLSYLFSHMLIAPILKLTKGAQRFIQNNFKYKVNIHTRDELEVLGKAFNQVGDYLEKAREEQKNYENRLEKEIDLKTSQLKEIVDNVQKDKSDLENQQKAMLNILEDANDAQINLKNSKEDLEKNQKELELIVSLSQKLSVVNDLNSVADILYNHFFKIFKFSAMSFFVFSDKEKGVEAFRVYCVKDMGVGFVENIKKDVASFLLKIFKIDKESIKRYLLFMPKIFGKKPSRKDIKMNFNQNLFPLYYGDKKLGLINIYTEKKIEKDKKRIIENLMLNAGVFVSGIMSSLKSQQSKIKSLINSTSNGILMFDEGGELSLINPAAIHLIQSDDSKKDLSLIFGAVKESGDNLQERIKNCINKGESVNLDEIKIGNKFVEISINPVKDDIGKIMGVAMIIHDITQMKQIDNMKTEFVSVASHQLRTPLTAIKLFTEMLMNEQVGKLKKEQKKYLDNVYQSTDRMVRLVNDLLNVSRIESGRLSIVPELIFVDKFISTIIEEAKPLAQAKNCKIIFLKPKKKLARIALDVNLVRQVVHNLITNAIKYSREEGGFVNVELKNYDQKNILIKVSDNGIGIPKEKQDRIFQKFFRADNAVKSETEGTGLGLYVSKMIVESSGGKIWFDSKENKGTSFYFILPKKGMKKKEGAKGLSLS